MKKLLLSLAVISLGFSASAQEVVLGVSPGSIQGSYTFAVQTDNGWPRYVGTGSFGGPTSENWGLSYDFSINGEHVQAELVLVNDGTAGTSTDYGHLLAEEGCNPSPAGAYTGKIAVLRRGTCSFELKAKNAQDAGAVAVLVVDHFDDNNLENQYMSAGGTEGGPSVTIPVVRVSRTDGNAIIAEMGNGPVEFFIGNPLGIFEYDLHATKGEFLVPPFGGTHKAIFTGFDVGVQLYNFGYTDLTDIVANATITGPSGIVYNEDLTNITANGFAADTIALFPGNGPGLEFPAYVYDGMSHPDGDYTLTYTISSAANADNNPYDNSYTVEYKVQDEIISLARLDASNRPVANTYPSNAEVEYRSCMFFEDPNASALGVQGIYFYADTNAAETGVAEFAGEEILVQAYQWNDSWTDINDPAFTFAAYTDPGAADYAFGGINPQNSVSYYAQDDNEVETLLYKSFDTPFLLEDDRRYLFCLTTYNPGVVAFGYDNATDHGANYSILGSPVSPLYINDNAGSEPAGAPTTFTWYNAGWNGSSASSIGLKTFDASELNVPINEMINGSAYPNPANNMVTISIEAEGNATLEVTDVAGRKAMFANISLVNGRSTVDVSSLETGVYVFNVVLENGLKAQFNIVKK